MMAPASPATVIYVFHKLQALLRLTSIICPPIFVRFRGAERELWGCHVPSTYVKGVLQNP
ncbi:hypothetical protein BD310DRAFT_915753 [Dichomitus squalens]|uniref:Uncharacterized protein n=1 Tax=Dichomitus squalens TaxID=114155 RepID=A0A4V2K9G0_9APHY|nr:hypothetical protein BD310DRAFT_915753 [Dichomitus squalens]